MSRVAAAPGDATTRTLLALGVGAAPIFIIVALLQIVIRPGFDVTRHALSLLSNGPWGWVQVLNFVISGVLIVCGSAGLKRALAAGPGRTWTPTLLGTYGVGLIGAGAFSADPGLGFPPGAADAISISWHGVLHVIFGTVGFIGFMGACFTAAWRFRTTRDSTWAWYSFVTGMILTASFVSLSSGSTGAASLPFSVAGSLGLVWIAALLARVESQLREERTLG